MAFRSDNWMKVTETQSWFNRKLFHIQYFAIMFGGNAIEMFPFYISKIIDLYSAYGSFLFSGIHFLTSSHYFKRLFWQYHKFGKSVCLTNVNVNYVTSTIHMIIYHKIWSRYFSFNAWKLCIQLHNMICMTILISFDSVKRILDVNICFIS